MATFEQPSNVDPNNNIVRNWLIGIGVALFVIVGITFALHRKETLAPLMAGVEASTTSSTSTTNAPGTTGILSNASPNTQTTSSMGETVYAIDQKAGYSVTIDSMSLTRKSWVAIKDTKGYILGAGLFQMGATTGEVPLLRATKAGERYEVLIYVDDSNKTFDLHKDMLVVAADGSPVGSAFNAK
jgi:hypothetical protein